MSESEVRRLVLERREATGDGCSMISRWLWKEYGVEYSQAQVARVVYG